MRRNRIFGPPTALTGPSPSVRVPSRLQRCVRSSLHLSNFHVETVQQLHWPIAHEMTNVQASLWNGRESDANCRPPPVTPPQQHLQTEGGPWERLYCAGHSDTPSGGDAAGLAAELTQCRLLCRARARQVEILQGRLQEAQAAHQAAAAAGAQQAQVAAAAEARASGAEAGLREAAVKLSRAQEGEAEAHHRCVAETSFLATASEVLPSHHSFYSLPALLPARRLRGLESDLAVARMEADSQAQRIAELGQSVPGRLEQRYDAQLRRLQQESEAELRRLRGELAAALAKPTLALPHRSSEAAAGGAACSQEGWAEIFGETAAASSEACDAEAQTESGLSAGSTEVNGAAVLAVLQSARAEIERLQAANAQLAASEAEGKCHGERDKLRQLLQFS